ncbi:MAG TPA: cation transporter [Bacteroidetes bacterium]|nr:cation transporter [Bacteroidota bacterium]
MRAGPPARQTGCARTPGDAIFRLPGEEPAGGEEQERGKVVTSDTIEEHHGGEREADQRRPGGVDIAGEREKFLGDRRAAKRVTWAGAVINLLLALMKGTAGMVFTSRALVADAVDSLNDLLTDGIALAAYPLAHKPVDRSHPYGHGRVESLAAMVVSAFLMLAAVGIGAKAVYSLLTHNILIPRWPAIIFACISLATKEWMYHWTMRVAKQTGSQVLAANAWNHRGDAFSSVAVLLGISGSLLIPGGEILDAIASLVVVVLILRAAVGIARRSANDLVDKAQDEALLKRIVSEAQAVQGVINAHRARSRRYGHLIYLDLDIEVDPGMSVDDSHTLSHRVKDRLLARYNRIADVQIHVEPEGDHLHGEGFVRDR